MLVLTRRPDQTITVGGDADPNEAQPPIEVTVIEVRGGQVKIGIRAPRGVSVDRTEIRASKRQETTEAGSD